MSLFTMRAFFREERCRREPRMGATEMCRTTTRRRLTSYTATELASLRAGALDFVKLCEQELSARDDVPPSSEVR